MFSVPLHEMIKTYGLTALTKVDTEGKVLLHPEINRPALQLAGFFDYFDSERLQIMGIVEYTYLERMEKAKKKAVLQKIFGYKIPCLVLCRNLHPPDEMVYYAEKNDVPILQTELPTSDFMSEVIKWLKVQLAPRVTMHGVLVDIYGEGVLITGESGIGKSETALELVKRGHRLVADDSVEIKRVSHETLIGTCPELIRYFIELRGIGIVNIQQMFGVQAVKATKNIDLIIKLEIWDKSKEYDRLGLREEFVEVLGKEVIANTIPVRPGRNLALICESAAINLRQKKMGYNAAQALSERIELT